MKNQKYPNELCCVSLNDRTSLTYRLLKTDYVDINEGGDKLRPSYSILLVKSGVGDEAGFNLVFDLTPEKERALRMLETLADGEVSPEEIEEILSEIL